MGGEDQIKYPLPAPTGKGYLDNFRQKVSGSSLFGCLYITLPRVHDATANIILTSTVSTDAPDARPSHPIEIEAACSAHVPR